MADEEPVILDEGETPLGTIQLVAYRRGDATWVGLKEKAGKPFGAIGLHTGSLDTQLETTSWMEAGWGVAFGAVAPGIVRVEVRNDEGEVFPGTIVTLPKGFDPDYRAVWALAERCRSRCEMVGFDDRGRPYDQTDPRLFGPPPSDDDRLDAIRRHADGAMRYYATAYLRESEKNRELMREYMAPIANFLALLDRDGLDDRSMLAGSQKIVQRVESRGRRNTSMRRWLDGLRAAAEAGARVSGADPITGTPDGGVA